MKHERTRKQRSPTKPAITNTASNVAIESEPLGDHRGYLAIGLAAGGLAVVSLVVVMIVLAAT